ncbi:hypothetical protein, partial [Thermococcus sp. MAR1]|uniref:hypothetical protein n=1 Tax=Thermococcus sp. MAR1 TaxID=1638263 RepID=UPI00198139F3
EGGKTRRTRQDGRVKGLCDGGCRNLRPEAQKRDGELQCYPGKREKLSSKGEADPRENKKTIRKPKSNLLKIKDIGPKTLAKLKMAGIL